MNDAVINPQTGLHSGAIIVPGATWLVPKGAGPGGPELLERLKGAGRDFVEAPGVAGLPISRTESRFC